MKYEERIIELPGQLTGPAELHVYCQKPLVEGDKRGAVLILPGGGYSHVSWKEGEPVAMHFAAKGYQAFVLRYSVAPNVYPTARREVEAAFELIRTHAEQWYVDTEQIFLMGFSAGAHLALDYAEEREAQMQKPAGLILCYPVVSSGEYRHKGSFENLLGCRPDEEKVVLMERLSLEKHVDVQQLPPVFLWSTWTDETVPVENTLLLASALKEAGINTELHIFPQGAHGLCLANEVTAEGRADRVEPAVQCWTSLLENWMRGIKEKAGV